MTYTKKQEIIDDIQTRIRSGEYPPKSKLPTGREMEAAYHCSSEPIARATDYLKATGWVVGAPGSGIYVTEKPPISS